LSAHSALVFSMHRVCGIGNMRHSIHRTLAPCGGKQSELHGQAKHSAESSCWLAARVLQEAVPIPTGATPTSTIPTFQKSTDVEVRRRLRSSTSTLIVLSTRRSTLGDHAFPVPAARAWNYSSARGQKLNPIPARPREQWRF